jgi:prepilin-type N-terminal cleavage/methylation domain-containing protein
MRGKIRNGFSLMEILVVLAIISVLAAIAIWNYMGALNRGKQKRTMADIRNIAAAWESHAADARSYSSAGFTFPAVGVSYGALTGILSPTYIRSMPQTDGWSRPFAFGADAAVGPAGSATTYAIRSAGRDGTFNRSTYTPGATTDYDCDIVYSGGTFVSWPEGVQGHD